MLKPIGPFLVDRRRFLLGGAAASLVGCAGATPKPLAPIATASPPAREFAVVVRGGRVIDPGQRLDATADVAIEEARVAAVGPALRGRTVLDASGCVVAPGFVDLHSHAQSVAGHRLQAFDGVTTTLELEAGAPAVTAAYARAGVEGRPLNYGYSASWAAARIQVLTGTPAEQLATTMLARIGDPAWHREATAAEQDRILGVLESELAAGALGIGVLLGYAPGTSPEEYLRVARLAAARRVPTYTHARALVEVAPETRVDGAEELVRAAAETGAHMHFCHVNSTSGRRVERVLALVDRVRREGSVVTTEAYPYGAGMTVIGAVFLAPERLAAAGLSPTDIVYVPTNERVRDAERLRHLRTADPGGRCIVHFLDETKPADARLLRVPLLHRDTMVASDAIGISGIAPAAQLAWPLPPGARTHPRTAGTFARAFRHLVGDGSLGIAESSAARACSRPACSRPPPAAPRARARWRWARTPTWSSSSPRRSATGRPMSRRCSPRRGSGISWSAESRSFEMGRWSSTPGPAVRRAGSDAQPCAWPSVAHLVVRRCQSRGGPGCRDGAPRRPRGRIEPEGVFEGARRS